MEIWSIVKFGIRLPRTREVASARRGCPAHARIGLDRDDRSRTAMRLPRTREVASHTRKKQVAGLLRPLAPLPPLHWAAVRMRADKRRAHRRSAWGLRLLHATIVPARENTDPAIFARALSVCRPKTCRPSRAVARPRCVALHGLGSSRYTGIVPSS